MKILMQGKLPDPKLLTPWWVDKKIRCKNCFTVFQLEAKDNFATEKVLKYAKCMDEYLYLHCPYCKLELKVVYRDFDPQKSSIFADMLGGHFGGCDSIFKKFFDDSHV